MKKHRSISVHLSIIIIIMNLLNLLSIESIRIQNLGPRCSLFVRSLFVRSFVRSFAHFLGRTSRRAWRSGCFVTRLFFSCVLSQSKGVKQFSRVCCSHIFPRISKKQCALFCLFLLLPTTPTTFKKSNAKQRDQDVFPY
jgi:hypothetical protein